MNALLRTTRTIIYVLLLLLSLPAGSFAAHPLITDDTGTQGAGKFQVEFNGGYAVDRNIVSGIPSEDTAAQTGVSLTYGITGNTDLVIGVPCQWHRLKETGVTILNDRGIGDLSLEFKWKCYTDENNGLSLALKPGFSIPCGNEKKGFGSGAVNGWVMLIATSSGRLGCLHGNLGYIRAGYGSSEIRSVSRSNLLHASLAAELNAANSLRAVANIGIDTNQDKTSSTDPVFLIGGLIYGITENFEIDLGLKCGLNDALPGHEFLWGLTAKF
jgi:hypothetical protein